MVEDAISRRIFTTADAARIAGVNPASARRWVTGYSYRYKGSTRTRAPRLGPSAGEVEGVLLMSFLDLIEIQMGRKPAKPKNNMAKDRQSGRAVPAAVGQRPSICLTEQSLFDVLDFREDGTSWRLWLGDRDSQVVVDPARAFGRPIIDAFGLPVSTLVAAYAANDHNIEPVAKWFDVPPEAVEAALRWNASLRRAA